MLTGSADRSTSRTDASSRIEFQIRPGVVFPDWQAIRSEAAKAGLLTMFRAVGIERRWTDYGRDLDQVRTAILQAFAMSGHAPSLSDLSEVTGKSEERVLEILRDLKSRDLVVIDASGKRITGAYPFTEHDTGHIALSEGRALRALCAIDALGVGAMVGNDTLVVSHCRACGARVQAQTGARGTTLVSVSPKDAVVWVSDYYAGNCGATSLCTTIAFFCSDEHLQTWHQASAMRATGHRLTAEEAHQVGCAIFGPILRRTGGSK